MGRRIRGGERQMGKAQPALAHCTSLVDSKADEAAPDFARHKTLRQKKTGKILNETNLHNITVFFMGLSRNLENKNPIKIPQDLQLEIQATDMNMNVWKVAGCTGGRPGMCKSYKKSSFSV